MFVPCLSCRISRSLKGKIELDMVCVSNFIQIWYKLNYSTFCTPHHHPPLNSLTDTNQQHHQVSNIFKKRKSTDPSCQWSRLTVSVGGEVTWWWQSISGCLSVSDLRPRWGETVTRREKERRRRRRKRRQVELQLTVCVLRVAWS